MKDALAVEEVKLKEAEDASSRMLIDLQARPIRNGIVFFYQLDLLTVSS